jgi:putative transcriptional regulator
MKKEMFDELIKSVKEGGAIIRGEKEPSRVFKIDAPDIKAIRGKINLSQKDFANMLGISPRTLQNWEQDRRSPNGPALVLLKVAEKHPEAVWDTVGLDSCFGLNPLKIAAELKSSIPNSQKAEQSALKPQKINLKKT